MGNVLSSEDMTTIHHGNAALRAFCGRSPQVTSDCLSQRARDVGLCLWSAWNTCWTNNRVAGDLRRCDGHSEDIWYFVNPKPELFSIVALLYTILRYIVCFMPGIHSTRLCWYEGRSKRTAIHVRSTCIINALSSKHCTHRLYGTWFHQKNYTYSWSWNQIYTVQFYCIFVVDSKLSVPLIFCFLLRFSPIAF